MMDCIKPPKPWMMCSPSEAHDRASFKELSSFECTVSTYDAHPRNRKPDPMKCVKKYRRSAAGGGVKVYVDENGKEYKRTLQELELTVDYLLGLFVNQKSDGMAEKFSLVKTVNFVDDRLRAVQVDLNTYFGNEDIDGNVLTIVRRMQVKLIRYNLLAQYLLSSLDSGYEWKFAHTALTTAISSFFSTFEGYHGDLGDTFHLDEVMSYAALLHIVTVVKNNETALPQTSSTGQRCGLASDGGGGISAVLGLYRKYVKSRENGETAKSASRCEKINKGRLYQKYHWALEVASAIENGDILTALRLLKPYKSYDERGVIHSEEQWRIISRCCVAQAVPILRIGLIRRYNKSFGKQEKVKNVDLAHLLHLPTADSAVVFCQNIGLPTSSYSDGGKHDYAVMKAAPISIEGKNIAKMTNPGRTEDRFVFGSKEWLKKEESKKSDSMKGMSSLQRAMMQMKMNEDPNEIMLDDSSFSTESRVDENGVLIIPVSVLSDLIGLVA